MSASNGKQEPKIVIDCPKCKVRFTAQMPEGEVMNSPRFSGFVATHERFTLCPNCRQPFALGIANVSVTWGAEPVPDEVVAMMEESRIIVPNGPPPPH